VGMSTYKVKLIKLLNRKLPKTDRIVVSGSLKIETNAIEIANYLIANVRKPLFFIAAKEFEDEIKNLLDNRIQIASYGTFFSYFLQLTSKYIFSTHGSIIAGSSPKQIEVNIWHGILYKKIRKLRNEPEIHATYTVGTSPLSKKMFSEAFGVPSESVLITGYPRNDLMLRSQQNKQYIKEKIRPALNQYHKLLLWLPTFRRIEGEKSGMYGMKNDNPFQISNFDAVQFNEILQGSNSICLIKPHYFYTKNQNFKNYSNIIFIDDEWISKQGITLYHLLGCTDILISDYSSVIIDFLLLDRPVICIGTDIEEYKKTQGLYFENLEEWLPTKLIETQQEFFNYTKYLITNSNDLYKEKREKLKEQFFTYFDANSSKRLIEIVFSNFSK
jgi:CDP-glycerol glycerophosphotransferase